MADFFLTDKDKAQLEAKIEAKEPKIAKPISVVNGGTGHDSLESSGLVPAVLAKSSDGKAYTATVNGIKSLKRGMLINFVPQKQSTDKQITLDINGLGAKRVYPSKKDSSSAYEQLWHTKNFFNPGCGMLLSYDGTYWKSVAPYDYGEAQIESTQYTGTETCGSENPNVLTFSAIRPELVFVYPVNSNTEARPTTVFVTSCAFACTISNEGTTIINARYSESDKTLKWWTNKSAADQLNSNKVYNVVIIGKGY